MEQKKPNIFIRTNFDLCTGCLLCKTACSMHVFGGYNPNKGMLIIRHLWANLAHIPVVCQQCQNPMCMKVCPVNAISRDEKTRAVVIDQDKCISCKLCSQYCPLGVIHRDRETQKAYKCDLCQGDPQCVQVCPFQALELVHEQKHNGEQDGTITHE